MLQDKLIGGQTRRSWLPSNSADGEMIDIGGGRFAGYASVLSLSRRSGALTERREQTLKIVDGRTQCWEDICHLSSYTIDIL